MLIVNCTGIIVYIIFMLYFILVGCLFLMGGYRLSVGRMTSFPQNSHNPCNTSGYHQSCGKAISICGIRKFPHQFPQLATNLSTTTPYNPLQPFLLSLHTSHNNTLHHSFIHHKIIIIVVITSI